MPSAPSRPFPAPRSQAVRRARTPQPRWSRRHSNRGGQDVERLEYLAQGSPDERPHSLALQAV